MWFVASIPFWLIGAWCLWSAGASLVIKKPNESSQDQVEQMLWNLVAAGVAFYIAAKIAT